MFHVLIWAVWYMLLKQNNDEINIILSMYGVKEKICIKLVCGVKKTMKNKEKKKKTPKLFLFSENRQWKEKLYPSWWRRRLSSRLLKSNARSFDKLWKRRHIMRGRRYRRKTLEVVVVIGISCRCLKRRKRKKRKSSSYREKPQMLWWWWKSAWQLKYVKNIIMWKTMVIMMKKKKKEGKPAIKQKRLVAWKEKYMSAKSAPQRGGSSAGNVNAGSKTLLAAFAAACGHEIWWYENEGEGSLFGISLLNSVAENWTIVK